MKTNENYLFNGAQFGNLSLIRQALASDVDPNAVDSHGDTALHVAACYGKTEAVELLLENKAEVDVKNRHNKTPLYAAACNGHVEAVTVLLENGANVNARDKNDDTPLHEATKAYTPHIGVINLLIARGADIKAKNKENKIPLNYYFARFMELEGDIAEFSSKILLALGASLADINAKDKYGHTLLHKTARHKNNQEIFNYC
jgi:cytohesin